MRLESTDSWRARQRGGGQDVVDFAQKGLLGAWVVVASAERGEHEDDPRFAVGTYSAENGSSPTPRCILSSNVICGMKTHIAASQTCPDGLSNGILTSATPLAPKRGLSSNWTENRVKQERSGIATGSL
jgi:hypothetical protein